VANPPELLATGDDDKLLAHVLGQLSDPEAFLSKVKQLYASRERSMDTLLFQDGRVFERFSCPLIQNDTLTGRVWSFRDVTRAGSTPPRRSGLPSSRSITAPSRPSG